MTADSTSRAFHVDHRPMGQSTFVLLDVDKVEFDPAKNGRFDGHDEGEIRALALSILDKSQPSKAGRPMFHGQIQPAVIARDANGVPQLIAGFGRRAAIDYINNNVSDPDIAGELERLKLLDSKGALETPFPLKAVIAPAMDDHRRELFNLAENAERKDLSHMDWAIVVQRMARRGMSDAAIAAALAPYHPTKKEEVSTSWVAMHRAVCEVSPELQRRVHTGDIPIFRAIEIWRSAKEITDPDTGKPLSGEDLAAEQDRILNEAVKPDGKVDGAKLRANNRVQNANRGASSVMTIAEFRKILDESIAATGSTVAMKINAVIKSEITREEALSWLADFGPEDFAPGDGKVKRTRKTAGAKPGPKGGKRGDKVGVKAADPVVGIAPENAPAVDDNGIRLPARAAPNANGGARKAGGRTKKPKIVKAAEIEADEVEQEQIELPQPSALTADGRIDVPDFSAKPEQDDSPEDDGLGGNGEDPAEETEL